MMSNQTNVALYIGITSNLPGRVFQHKEKQVPGFTSRYGINKLVYYEVFESIESAITREKRLKGSSRARKNRLIESVNPGWEDLYEGLLG